MPRTGRGGQNRVAGLFGIGGAGIEAHTLVVFDEAQREGRDHRARCRDIGAQRDIGGFGAFERRLERGLFLARSVMAVTVTRAGAIEILARGPVRRL
ncbi:hypothetical protein QWZ10_12665 [Paracoccus cavernae]|uniref:Uncharacterized protein n=1 Tax=Paracoccus cavernae TaxID=1571207 RepID=A0ABT8D6J8_9RHOB|nr:hypothetical protein [Paracoccus cavernae]